MSQRITQLNEILGPSVDVANDLLTIVDVSDTTMALSGTNKKIRVGQLLSLASATPAGVDGNIQFNNAGAFGASNNLHWDKINNRLSVGMGLYPAARVDILSPGNLSSDTALRVRDNSNAIDLMRVQGNGNVNLIGLNNDISIGSNAVSNTNAIIYGRSITAGIADLLIGSSIVSASDTTISIGTIISSSMGEQINVGYQIRNSAYRSSLIGRGLNYSNSVNNQNTIGFGYYTTPTTPKLNFKGGAFNQLLLGYAPEEFNYSNNSGSNWFAIALGTPPAGQIDAFQMYADEASPGNAAPHFRTEAGDIIRLYQETTSVGSAAFVANIGTVVNDNSTFGGYTIGQVVQALKNFGLLQ